MIVLNVWGRSCKMGLLHLARCSGERHLHVKRTSGDQQRAGPKPKV